MYLTLCVCVEEGGVSGADPEVKIVWMREASNYFFKHFIVNLLVSPFFFFFWGGGVGQS